jgi:Flp pilus assembly protein TadG
MLSRIGRAGRARRGRLPRGSRVSRGQALVEFCFIVPILFLMVVGSTSISTLLDDHLNILYAVRSAARVGSTLGQAGNADCAIIGALDAALANDHNINVSLITIYQVKDSNGVLSVGGYDSYPGNAVCTSAGAVSPGYITLGWPPASRSNTPFSEDSIGVQIT